MRILCLLLLTGILFSSCQKEISWDGFVDPGGGGGGTGGGGSSTYYIRFKKDGVQKEFTAAAMAKITNFGAAGFIGLNLVANQSLSSLEGLNIGANFFNGTSPAVGVYTENDPSTNYLVAGVYNPNSTTIVYGAGIYFPSAKPLVIRILTMTATEMTGTFEGAFYKTDVASGSLPTGEHFLFTEGQFKLKIQ